MDITQSIIDQAPEGATHVEPSPPALFYKPDGDGIRMLASYGGNDPWEPIMRTAGDTRGLLPMPPKTSAPLQTEREPDLICASDRASIAAFVPPPEPPKVEQLVRVSTLNRSWRWL